MRPERPAPRRTAPGERALVERLLALARRAREQPMDPDLPDRVLAALGLSIPHRPLPRRAAPRRAALALGLLAILALLLLPPGEESAARLAEAPLLSAPAPRPAAVPASAQVGSPTAPRLEPAR